MKKFFTFLVIIAVIIGIALAVIIPKIKNGEDVPEKEFVISDSDGAVIDKEIEMTFVAGVTYTFNASKGYGLELISNTEGKPSDFEYKVDSTPKKFSQEVRLINAFEIKRLENGFSISTKPGTTVKSILESIYPGKEVAIPEDKQNSTETLFTLVITERNGAGIVKINFSLITMSVDIPREIIF